VHQGGSRGIGRILRGLCASLPSALSPEDELVVVGHQYQRREERKSRVSPSTATTPRARRLLYEQLYVPFAARSADLVHLCDSRPLVLSRRPFLLTVHDVFSLDHPEWFPTLTVSYRNAMLAAAVRKRPEIVVCVSNYTRERLLAHFPQAAELRVYVIHPGLQPVEHAEASHARDAPYFLTVATLEPRKNHLGLLEAFRAARRSGLRLTWKVAGAVGVSAAEIVRALRTEPGVELLGHVSEDELERLYAGATFVAMPSHAEGFGFPPLEAMARGVPAICSTGSAIDETVGDAALRVPSRDVRGWGDALATLATDASERERLRKLGLEHVGRFELAQAAHAYVEAYRGALS
jgi:glycosyltransferase involved in cell wall biosynthesis